MSFPVPSNYIFQQLKAIVEQLFYISGFVPPQPDPIERTQAACVHECFEKQGNLTFGLTCRLYRNYGTQTWATRELAAPPLGIAQP